MTDPGELGRALAAIAVALDALSVKWAIGGSLASAAHGEPRATNDVDIIALLDEGSAVELAKRLEKDFYADPESARSAVRSRGSFNVIDSKSFIKIDIFIPSPGPMGAGQLDRRQTLEILTGVPALPILGPEDTILQKLRWYRLGGEVSDRQWRDVVGVIRGSAGGLDHAYLDAVASGADLVPLLVRARSDAAR
jgi:hypothetical protein